MCLQLKHGKDDGSVPSAHDTSDQLFVGVFNLEWKSVNK